jgi:hypothetical protein
VFCSINNLIVFYSSGQFVIDETILRTQGIIDFSKYKTNPNSTEAELTPDFFVVSYLLGVFFSRGRRMLILNYVGKPENPLAHMSIPPRRVNLVVKPTSKL